MKIMIVDDEILALNRLKRLLTECNIEDIKAFNNPQDALSCSQNEAFEVVFLDISMPNMSGLELAQAILQHQSKTFIVFQTAHDTFALEAFQKGGMGYLLKPIDKKSVEAIIEKIRLFQGNNQEKEEKLLVKYFETSHLIAIKDICYIQANLDEVIIQTAQQEFYAKKKIKELEQFLKNKDFFRIHRSYLINVNQIKSMQSVEQSRLEIEFEGLDRVIVSSKEGAKEFREYLQTHTL